jgi:hypothetical protein
MPLRANLEFNRESFTIVPEPENIGPRTFLLLELLALVYYSLRDPFKELPCLAAYLSH